MMRTDNKILTDNAIGIHHTFIKSILLMKRESSLVHHFSFDEYSDERLMSAYEIECQLIMLHFHQIIIFSLITKPYENDNRRS